MGQQIYSESVIFVKTIYQLCHDNCKDIRQYSERSLFIRIPSKSCDCLPSIITVVQTAERQFAYRQHSNIYLSWAIIRQAAQIIKCTIGLVVLLQETKSVSSLQSHAFWNKWMDRIYYWIQEESSACTCTFFLIYLTCSIIFG